MCGLFAYKETIGLSHNEGQSKSLLLKIEEKNNKWGLECIPKVGILSVFLRFP